MDRISSPGKSTLFLNGQEVYDYTINFFNGYAYLNVGLPNNSKEGDVLKYTISVDDVSQVRPFEHEVWIKVTKAVKKLISRNRHILESLQHPISQVRTSISINGNAKCNGC